MASKRIRSLVGQIASFALAGALLYLALRGVDFGVVLLALKSANYWWLLPLAAMTILSHILRSWRWQILLRELPDAAPDQTPSLYNAFTSLIIGYFANYAAPRVGELVRSGLLARKEKLRMSGVVGTVVLERILDVIVLGVLIILVVFMLLDRVDTLRELFVDPLAQQWSAIPALAILAAVAIALTAATAAYLLWRRSQAKVEKPQGAGRLLQSFLDGIYTLSRTRRKGAILASTVLMWSCYVVMTYMPFLVLGMTETYDITLVDSFYLMTLGAIGVAIPAPGGTGSYHYIAIQSLVHIFGVAQSPAATYAVLTHAAQLVLYVAMGSFFLVTQNTSIGELKKLKEESATAPTSSAVR